MKAPATALFWYCWQKTWPGLSIQITTVIVLTAIVFNFMDTDANVQQRANAITVTVLTSSLVLAIAWLSSLAKSSGSNLRRGFPMAREFQFPVSTPVLVAIPYFTFCLLVYLSFLIPTQLLSVVYDTNKPHLVVHFLVIQIAMLIFALTWFSSNNRLVYLGQGVALLLIWSGRLFPAFTIGVDGSVLVDAPDTFFIPALLTLAAATLMYFGVSKQRHGENLFLNNEENSSGFSAAMLRDKYLFYYSPCPKHSPTAALFWREWQFRGLQASGTLGAVLAVTLLLLVNVLLQQEWEEEPGLELINGFALIMLATVFMPALASVFGISYKNGASRVSTFDRTLPISTTRLVSIRLSAALSGIFVCVASLYFTIWLVGPLFIHNFADIRAEALLAITTYFDRPFPELITQLLLQFGFIFTASVMWAAFVSWYALHTRFMTLLITGIMLYEMVLLIIVNNFFSEPTAFPMAERVMSSNHWILVLGIPLFLVFSFRSILKDKILTQPQFFIIVTVCLLLASAQLYDMAINPGEFEDMLMIKIISNAMQGLLPLTAIGLALWTQGRIRHG